MKDNKLIQNAIFPDPHLIFFDKDGNYQGESINLMPLELLLGRIGAIAAYIWYLIMPLFGPLQYALVSWVINKADPVLSKEYPKIWPKKKKKILTWYTQMFWVWVVYMGICWAFNWFQ